jgi:hypothetical protein
VFDNDNKGCYDQIFSDIALACLRRMGYSKNLVKLLGSLWAQLEHHICTGFGVLDKSYSSSLDKLLYGIEQGSCSSSILWALLNQLLLTALGENFDCIHLISIDGSSNTTRQPTDHDVKDLTDEEGKLVARIEDIIQFFLDLLQVTGGDLTPEK